MAVIFKEAGAFIWGFIETDLLEKLFKVVEFRGGLNGESALEEAAQARVPNVADRRRAPTEVAVEGRHFIG